MAYPSFITLRKLISVTMLCLGIAACVTTNDNRLEQNKDPQKALKSYVEAGLIYLKNNQMDNANRTLTRAYEIDPNDASVNNALALFFGVEGDKDQTEKHFKKALSSDPSFSQARNNYAVFLFDNKRYEEAIAQLELVGKDYRYDRRYTAYENLGICYLKTGDKENAEKAFNRSLKLNPRMSTSMLELAQLYYDKGDMRSAQQYLASYESMSQPSAKQLWLGIRLQQSLGDKNKLSSYELALKNMFPASAEYKAYKASKQP